MRGGEDLRGDAEFIEQGPCVRIEAIAAHFVAGEGGFLDDECAKARLGTECGAG